MGLDAFSEKKDLVEAEVCRDYLHEFVKRAWSIVEPGTTFVDGPHVKAICDHLEAVTQRKIRNLIINQPPRTMKSLLVSVFWPCWVWTFSPESRFMFASYSQALSTRDSLKCRRIIESPWYRRLFGSVFGMQSDQNQKMRFENDKMGFRLATSVGGATTGEGADFVVCDDPVSAMDSSSHKVMDSTNQWWDEVMSTRLNDQKTGCRIIVMQRLASDDLSGHLIKRGTYEHLCIPMEFDPESAKPTSIWMDWRKRDGELLWPARIDADALAALKLELGSYGVAGQLQQRPSPRGGGMFKRAWFEIVKAAPADGRVIRYWDRAGSKKTQDNKPDWTAGVKTRRAPNGMFYIEHVERFQGEPLENERRIKNTAIQDGVECMVGIEQDPGQAGKSEAGAHVRNLAGFNVRVFNVTKSKEVRATPAAAQAEAGNIKLVDGPWVEAFLREVETFPTGENDDQVDGLSGGINALSEASLPFV